MKFLNYLQQNNLKRLIKPMLFHIVHTKLLKNLRFYKLFEARWVEIIKNFHRFCFKKLRSFMISGIKKIKKIKKIQKIKNIKNTLLRNPQLSSSQPSSVWIQRNLEECILNFLNFIIFRIFFEFS